MYHRLLRRGCLSCPGWVCIHLLSPMNASCPTSNASSKTQCQHDRICRKSVVLLSTHLSLAEGQASSENDPIAMCPRHMAFLLSCLVLGCVVPPFAQPAGGSLQQEVCSKRKSITFPRTVPHKCWGFFLSQDGGLRRCACCISLFKILKEFSSIGLVMPLSQAGGAPSQAHEQSW